MVYFTFEAFISLVLCLFQASKLLKKDLPRCRGYLLNILKTCRFVKVVPGSYIHTALPMESKSKCQRLFSKSSLINFELCVTGILVSQCVLCLAVDFRLSFYANEPETSDKILVWLGSMAFWSQLHLREREHAYTSKQNLSEAGFSVDMSFVEMEGSST